MPTATNRLRNLYELLTSEDHADRLAALTKQENRISPLEMADILKDAISWREHVTAHACAPRMDDGERGR